MTRWSTLTGRAVTRHPAGPARRYVALCTPDAWRATTPLVGYAEAGVDGWRFYRFDTPGKGATAGDPTPGPVHRTADAAIADAVGGEP